MGLFLLVVWLTRDLREPGPAGPAPAPAAAGPALVPDARGCIRPAGAPRTPPSALQPEAPAYSHWHDAGVAGERVREDACGSLWFLWYNSWTVLDQGDPQRAHAVRPPVAGPIGELARRGIADFLFTPAGDLWILGRDGRAAQFAHGVWRVLEPGVSRPGTAGAIAWHAGRPWRAQAGVTGAGALTPLDPHPLSTPADAIAPPPLAGGVARLAATPWGTLVAAGDGAVAQFQDAVWSAPTAISGRPLALATGDGRLYVATDDGLHVLDRNGARLAHHLSGEAVTGVVARPGDALWVGTRNGGLRYFDGERWQAWRYAEGLPADDVRDLMLARGGRLWAAGSRSAVIDITSAEQRVTALRSRPRLAEPVFADACAAAAAVLEGRSGSGAIATVSIEGRTFVFFGRRQACPPPDASPPDSPLATRRAADGAVLVLDFDGRRRLRSCGRPCTDAAAAALRATWSMTLHRPATSASPIPPPEPLPSQSPLGAPLLDDLGTVWVATREEGVFRHHDDDWHRYGEDAGFGPHNPVQDLAQDGAGGIWVATQPEYLPVEGRHGGTGLHRREGGRWLHYGHEQGLGDGGYSALEPLRDGGMAAAGNDGLVTVRAQGLRRFGRPEMGARAFATAIAEDAGGHLWLGHGTRVPGITWFDGLAFRALTTREGLFADRIVLVGHDDEGRVWLLADDGRVAVYPRATLVERMTAGFDLER